MTAKASDWSPISNERTCDSLVGGATPTRRRHESEVVVRSLGRTVSGGGR